MFEVTNDWSNQCVIRRFYFSIYFDVVGKMKAIWIFDHTTQVVYEILYNKWSPKWSLWHTGLSFVQCVICATLGNTVSSVGQVTTEPGNIRRRQSEAIKFTKKDCTRNWIESVAKIEINGINLRVGMNQASNEVETSTKICRCRFRFDESMLTGIKFRLQIAWNVLICDDFNFFGKGFEKSDNPVKIH